MKESKIKPEDVNLLCRVLNLSGEVIVFDPKGKITNYIGSVARDITTLLKEANAYTICVNLSGQKLEVFSFDFILEVGASKQKYKSFFCEQFLTINNPDKTIRWFLPANSSYPNFLTLYNGSGIKASAFGILARFAFKLGLQKWFCQGNFCLYSKKENYIQRRFSSAEFALFTGTVGENRKAVAAICEYGKATHFVKIPISKKAQYLVDTENRHLVKMEKLDFEKLNVPSPSMSKMGLRLTNIRPEQPISLDKIEPIHIHALKDLYANTFQVKVLARLDEYKKTITRLAAIKERRRDSQCIPDRKIERLAYNLKVLLHTFDEQTLLPVAYAHGDFTPWNMFVSKYKVHLYDWELAMPEQLFLYDAFHFIFQSGVLILQEPFEAIKAKIVHLEKTEEVEGLIERYRLNFWDCYRWYLLSNCSYYLNIYMQEENLHPQAFWLIDCWIAASTDAIKSPKEKTQLAF